MSDFGDVEFFDNLEELSSNSTPLAPDGEHNAQIIATDKYKSNAGNWTLKVTFQLDGGKYKDHNEWYNLWATNEDNKRISTEIFTRLTKSDLRLNRLMISFKVTMVWLILRRLRSDYIYQKLMLT